MPIDPMTGLPVANDWSQWALGGFAPPSITPPIGGTGTPIQLPQASPSAAPSPAPFDASIDPSTGAYVAPNSIPSPVQAARARQLAGNMLSLGANVMPSQPAIAPSPTPSAPPPPAPTPSPQPYNDPAASVAAAAANRARAAQAGVLVPQQAPQAPQQPQGEQPGPRDYAALTPLIIGGESAGNPNAKNSKSSAAGLGGFTDGTWQQFINSPANTGKWTMADRGNPQAVSAAIPWYASTNDSVFQAQLGRPATTSELLAAHMLGGAGAAALAANPNANARDVLAKVEPKSVDAVFANNSTVLNPSMTASQALASAAGIYTKQGGSQVASAADNQPAQELMVDKQPASAAPQGAPSGVTLPYPNVQLPPGSSALALASGLLQPGTFGESLGKGLSNMIGVQQADMGNKMKANEMALELGQLGMTAQYRNALIADAQQRIGQGDARVGIAAQNAANNTVRTNNAVTNTANRWDPTLNGQLAGAKTGATTATKENVGDIDAMLENGASAPVKQQQINAALQTLQTSGTGPGLLAAKRALASYFNVPIGDTVPQSSQLMAAIDSNLRGGGFMGKNMRTQKEFNTIFEGLPNMDQNPQAAASVLHSVQNLTNYQQQMHDDWLALPQDQRQAMRNDQDAFQSWVAKEGAQFSSKMNSQGGIYAAPGYQSASPAAGGAVSGTSNGVTWKFTPN